jgi:hypothetical protein
MYKTLKGIAAELSKDITEMSAEDGRCLFLGQLFYSRTGTKINARWIFYSVLCGG